ncbi:MAG: molybdenum cofactor biosynthesis protein MoaE [Candidatus Sericytochromatia bacterium]
MLEITDRLLVLAPLTDWVSAPHVGAVSTFAGVVRDHNLGKSVRYLEYECYTPMALAELEKIVAQAHARWQLHRIAIAHRTGRLEIGETAVLIAVSAVHRRESIEALHFVIDTLKQTVPIWKKEYWSDGSMWLEGCSH